MRWCSPAMQSYVFVIEDGQKPAETHELDLATFQDARLEGARLVGSLIEHEPERFLSTASLQVTVRGEDRSVLFCVRAVELDTA